MFKVASDIKSIEQGTIEVPTRFAVEREHTFQQARLVLEGKTVSVKQTSAKSHVMRYYF